MPQLSWMRLEASFFLDIGCGYQGGGYFGLEQFVSDDLNDDDSIDVCIKHMEDAIKDAVSCGVPPGKELLYLQIGWPDERLWDAMAKMPQRFVLDFQRKIKETFDPNSLGDRNYQWLPEGWGEAPGTTAAKGKPARK